jgi:MFS family permease
LNSLRSLRHRNFRLYWFSQLVSLSGTWMQGMAQAWLMHRLTSSAFMLGLLGFMQFAPILLVTIWAGVISDRMDKRRLIMITQSASALQAIGMALVVSTGIVQPWMVLALAFAFGVINAFDLPARQSFLIEMVGKEDLPNAIALSSGAFNSARIVGPALAGVAIASIGEGPCFWINAASFLPVIAGLAMMRLPPFEPAEGAGGSHLSRLLEGYRYAAGSGTIRRLLVLVAFCAGLGFQYTVLLPIYANDILGAGAEGMGLLVSAFGIGSILAAAWMTRELDRRALRRNLLAGLLIASAGMGVFAWSRSMPLSLAMGFLAGLGLILYLATTSTLLQTTVEDAFRGRVMSFYTLMFLGTSPIGSLIAGWIAHVFGAPAATSVSAAALFGGAVVVYYRLRAIAAREATAGAPMIAAPLDTLG